MTDVSSDVVDFLRSEIVAADVPVSFSTADGIGFPAYDDVEQDVYVTPVSEDPIVPGSGTSFYTANHASGNPIQDRVWLVTIDCWGGQEDDDIYQSEGSHPDKVADNLGHQVADAFLDAAAQNAPAGYEWVGAEPPTTANDTDTVPTTYRRQVTARLKTTR